MRGIDTGMLSVFNMDLVIGLMTLKLAPGLQKCGRSDYQHKLYESTAMRSRTIDLIQTPFFEKAPRKPIISKRVVPFDEALAITMEIPL